MASHIYSSEELLYVRSKPLREDMHRKLYDRLKRDAELGDLIRVQTRPARRDQISHSHDVTYVMEGQQSTVPRQLDGTDSEWRYRGRTDSEHAEGQPISAPSDIVTQKDEGFQRFYKAVVSPTHVRVTAGGRIVPNTRSSISPGPKWPVEKAPSEAAPLDCSATNVSMSQGYGFPVPPSYAPMASMFSGYGPAMITGMGPPPPPIPIMPWHASMAFTPGFPIMTGANSMPQSQGSYEPKDSSKSDKRSEAGSIKAASIQGPLPEKNSFRASVPWILPQSPAYYHVPYHATPGYSLQPPPQMMVQPAADGSSQSCSIPSKESHGSAKSAPVTHGPASVAITQSPMSSIRPSEITKNQILSLRTSVKYLEAQLLYNKHQVDEKAVEQQVNMVRQQIQQFEKNLENQLTFESNHYPKSSGGKEQPASSASARGHLCSKASAASEESMDRRPYKLGNASNTSLAPSVRSKGGYEKKTSFSTGINSTKSVSAFAPIKANARALGANASQTLHRESSGGLPSTAALAPPFEPARKGAATSIPLPRCSDSRTWNEHERTSSSGVHSFREDRGSEKMPDRSLASLDTALPYLIGYLPAGVNPTSACDTDYAYTRELTEDELRARHLYWGDTPSHLLKGLPKFDGKDFYPPSPTKGRSTDRDTGSSYSRRRPPTGHSVLDYDLANSKAENDLFRSLEHVAPRATRGPTGIPTQSEAIARSSRGTEDIAASVAGYQRAESCNTRVGIRTSSEEGSVVRERTFTPSLPDKSSSDEAEDDKDLLFKGRRGVRQVSAKSHSNEIWRRMLKKGKTSSNAAPGAVSSTTVQGVLPHYSGYATASLTPAIANSTTPPPRLALTKAYDVGDSTMPAAMGDRKRENLPPMGGDNSTSTMALAGASFISS